MWGTIFVGVGKVRRGLNIRESELFHVIAFCSCSRSIAPTFPTPSIGPLYSSPSLIHPNTCASAYPTLKFDILDLHPFGALYRIPTLLVPSVGSTSPRLTINTHADIFPTILHPHVLVSFSFFCTLTAPFYFFYFIFCSDFSVTRT